MPGKRAFRPAPAPAYPNGLGHPRTGRRRRRRLGLCSGSRNFPTSTAARCTSRPSLLERAIGEINELKPDIVVVLRRPYDVRLSARVRSLRASTSTGSTATRSSSSPGTTTRATSATSTSRRMFGEAELGAPEGPGRDRRRRLERAGSRPRPDRPRGRYRVDRGAVRRACPAEDLRPAPPSAAGSRHRAGAQHRLRRGRRDRVPPACGRAGSSSRATSTSPTCGGSRICSSSMPAPSPRSGSR